MSNSETALVLHGNRKGSFRRTVGKDVIVFSPKVPVSVTKAQFAALVPDLGSTLVIATQQLNGRFGVDWLETKKVVLRAAQDRVDEAKKAKKNPRLTQFMQACLSQTDEIENEIKNPPQVYKRNLDELAMGLGLEPTVLALLLEDEGCPKRNDDLLSLTDTLAWLRTEEGREALKAATEAAKDLDADEDVSPEEEESEDEPLESIQLKNQSELSEAYGVEVATIKEWSKAGLKKNGSTYDSLEVFKFASEKGLLGGDVTELYELATENDFKVFDQEGTLTIYAAIGVPVESPDPLNTENIEGYLAELNAIINENETEE